MKLSKLRRTGTGLWRAGTGSRGPVRRRPQGPDVTDKVPALRFRQLRPNRHSPPHHSVGQNPKQGSRRRLLHFLNPQTRSLLAPFSRRPVTLGAMLSEQLLAYQHGVRIPDPRIVPQASLLGNISEFAVVESSASGTILSPARDHDRRNQQPGAESENEHSGVAHGSLFHNRLTCSPKPVNSRDNPQRSSRR